MKTDFINKKGSISRKETDEFEKFKSIQYKQYVSDYNRFDEQSKLILKGN